MTHTSRSAGVTLHRQHFGVPIPSAYSKEWIIQKTAETSVFGFCRVGSFLHFPAGTVRIDFNPILEKIVIFLHGNVIRRKEY